MAYCQHQEVKHGTRRCRTPCVAQARSFQPVTGPSCTQRHRCAIANVLPSPGCACWCYQCYQYLPSSTQTNSMKYHRTLQWRAPVCRPCIRVLHSHVDALASRQVCDRCNEQTAVGTLAGRKSAALAAVALHAHECGYAGPNNPSCEQQRLPRAFALATVLCLCCMPCTIVNSAVLHTYMHNAADRHSSVWLFPYKLCCMHQASPGMAAGSMQILRWWTDRYVHD